jgi:hypothetical protein
VIYKPGDGGGSVLKYSISGRINGDIIPMSQSTLISSTFSQTISTTTMEFVMLMNGPSTSDLDIVGGVVNSFVFAYGHENTFGYHKGRGSFDLDLQTLSPTKDDTEANNLQAHDTKANDAQAYDFTNNGQARDAQAEKELR